MLPLLLPMRALTLRPTPLPLPMRAWPLLWPPPPLPRPRKSAWKSAWQPVPPRRRAAPLLARACVVPARPTHSSRPTPSRDPPHSLSTVHAQAHAVCRTHRAEDEVAAIFRVPPPRFILVVAAGEGGVGGCKWVDGWRARGRSWAMMLVVGAPAHWHRARSDRPGQCQSREALTGVVPLRIRRIPPRPAASELTAAGAFGRVAGALGHV
jgi:hypothetical protein